MIVSFTKSEVFKHVGYIAADIEGLNHIIESCEEAKIGLFRDDQALEIRFPIINERD